MPTDAIGLRYRMSICSRSPGRPRRRARHALVRPSRFVIRNPSKNVTRLTFEHSTHGVEGREAYGLGASVLEDCDVRGADADRLRELGDRHFAAREHDVD